MAVACTWDEGFYRQVSTDTHTIQRWRLGMCTDTSPTFLWRQKVGQD